MPGSFLSCVAKLSSSLGGDRGGGDGEGGAVALFLPVVRDGGEGVRGGGVAGPILLVFRGGAGEGEDPRFFFCFGLAMVEVPVFGRKLVTLYIEG